VTTNQENVAILFSEDRAMQLDACIRTLALNCADGDICRKRVIFKCSDARHAGQYSVLRKEHPDVEFIVQCDFHKDLQAAPSGFRHVLFMVDDNLSVCPFRLCEILSALESETSVIGFSLRFGRNSESCYSQNDAARKLWKSCLRKCAMNTGENYSANYLKTPLTATYTIIRIERKYV